MNEVVTELRIDADTSGADQFSQAMDRSSTSAQKSVSSAQDYALAIAGVGAGVIGAAAALHGFIDYVGQQSQQLVDLADHATLAGMSVKEFQQTLFAARAAGISDKDFFSGIDKISADLTQASQKATEFGELFKQNGVAIKDSNGQLISTKQALTELMGLMENATPQVQQRIAAIAGVSASWIPFLKEGSDQFDAMKQKAEQLGIIIDDGTIAKAKEFNSQWKEAVAAWDLQFKASLASILPLMTQLANIAIQVINGVGSFTSDFTRLFTSIDRMSMPQLDAQLNSLYKFRDTIEEIEKSGQKQGLSEGILEKVLGLPAGASIGDIDKMIGDVAQHIDQLKGRIRITAAPSGDNSTGLPNMGGKDDIERTTDTIERQIARMKADADAAGEGAAALEHLRIENQLYAAAERQGVTDTEKYAEQFYNLAERASHAAAELAKAKVQAEIKFGAQTAFLGQDDAAIAQKLKDQYANVADALNSAEAAQLRFNNAAKGLSGSIESTLVSGLSDITTGTKTASQGFTDMENAIVKALEQMIIKLLIVEPLMKSLQLGLFGGGPITLGGPSGPTPFPEHHTGGIVGDPSMPTRYIHPAYFDHAPRFHGGGIAGDEVPIIARRGEGVFTAGQMAALGGGGTPQVNVVMNEHPNAQGEVTTRQNDNGGIDIEIAIAQIAAKSAGTPGGMLNRVMRSQLGASQRLTAR